MAANSDDDAAAARIAIAEAVARSAASDAKTTGRQSSAVDDHAVSSPAPQPSDVHQPAFAAPPGNSSTAVPANLDAHPSRTDDPAVAAANSGVASTNNDVLPSVEAAKSHAANPNIEGTGNISHVAVANDLGVSTVTRQEHERQQAVEQDSVPEKAQDQSTGTAVKQHDTAENEAMDKDTYNVWSRPEEVPKEVVEGLDNEELWKLVRRFDKQMYHVKATKDGRKRGLYPTRELDLLNAPDEEFSPDRLRSNIERLYITFVIGSAGFVKHIARLRSWGEFNRTATWCAAYFSFWLLGQSMTLVIGLIVTLMVYPASRDYLFPPAPLSMVSAKSGGLQKPKAGNTVGSKDSLTGAAEAHKGEAVENEASNFVNGIATAVMATSIGKAPESDIDQSSKQTKLDSALPDPTALTMAGGEAKTRTAGDLPTEAHNKAKDPMVDAIWKGMRPLMRGLEDFCDNYERMGNALSPTVHYPQHFARIRLAAVLLPVMLVTAFIPVAWLARGISFLIGVLFFSQPYMSRSWVWLNTHYPDWMELLKLEKTLLKDVPSNSQLTLALLRIGEDNNVPLPPPPKYTETPPERSPSPTLEENLPPVNPDTAERDLSHDHEYVGDDDSDSNTAVEEDMGHTAKGKDTDGKPGKKHRFVAFMKGAAKTSVTALMGADRVKATAGSERSKERSGVIKHRKYVDGPSMFRCRNAGKKGWAIIVSGSTSATTPCISWVSDKKLPGTTEFDPKFSVQLQDITELKKLGGLGWKSKLLIGGVLGMEVIDALKLVTATGDNVVLTALPRRDELFNRLIALSQNRWESY